MDNSKRMLKILMILMEHSGSNKRLQQKEIMYLLKKPDEDDYPCTPKTLSKTLHNLIETLNPPVYNKNNDEEFVIRYSGIFNGETKDTSAWKNGIPKKITDIYYMPRIRKSDAEIIIEGLQKLDSVSKVEKQKLIGKIEEIFGVSGNNKNSVTLFSVNSSVYTRENISLILEAAAKERQIIFNFNGYDKDRRLVPNKNEDGTDKLYTVNPYYVVNYKGNYYMLCNTVPYNGVSIYRVDLMSNIVKTEVTRKRIDEINEFSQSKDPQKFMEKHLNMMYDDERSVTLKVNTLKHAYTLVHDMFGDSFKFKRHIDDTYDEIEVKAAEEGIINLAMTAPYKIEVIRPDKLREKICERTNMLLNRYMDK